MRKCKQVIFPDFNVNEVYVGGNKLSSWCGWCLAVIDALFSVPPFAGTAYEAWNINPSKHPDYELPKNVYVPIFYRGDSNNWGHIALAFSDGKSCKIWTTPYRNKCELDMYEFDSIYVAINHLIKLGYGTEYLGWSRKLGSKTLVEYDKEKEDIKDDSVVTFKTGDIVVPTSLYSYDGVPLVQYDDEYVITEINGDRAVLSANRNGNLVVWSAMKLKNIRKK